MKEPLKIEKTLTKNPETLKELNELLKPKSDELPGKGKKSFHIILDSNWATHCLNQEFEDRDVRFFTPPQQNLEWSGQYCQRCREIWYKCECPPKTKQSSCE